MFSVVNIISSVNSWLHKTWFGIGSTCAEGLTVIVNVSERPVLLTPAFSNVGVTVIVAN